MTDWRILTSGEDEEKTYKCYRIIDINSADNSHNRIYDKMVLTSKEDAAMRCKVLNSELNQESWDPFAHTKSC